MRHTVTSSVIVTSLLVPLVASTASLSVMIDGSAAVFSDVPEVSWFALYVKQAAEVGIVSGYKDAQGSLTGKFGPSNNVTLAEALKIAVEGAGYDISPYRSNDMGPPIHWAEPYIAVANRMNFSFLDMNAGVFAFDRPATRAEVAQIFADAFRVNIETPVGNRYDDVNASTHFAFSIEALSRDDVLSGDMDAQGNATGRFRPTDSINRAETVKIVMRAREVYDEPGREVYVPEAAEDTFSIITYTNDGFSPVELHVEKGAKVFFINESSEQMWVASDPHPDHTNLEYFDAGRGRGVGEIYDFDFLHTGSWGFHNHMNPEHRGTIIVE